jgi:hypothetical protein
MAPGAIFAEGIHRILYLQSHRTGSEDHRYRKCPPDAMKQLNHASYPRSIKIFWAAMSASVVISRKRVMASPTSCHALCAAHELASGQIF